MVWLQLVSPLLTPTLVKSLTIPASVALFRLRRSRADRLSKRLAGPSNSSCLLLFLRNSLCATSAVPDPKSSPAFRIRLLASPPALTSPIRVQDVVHPCCTPPSTRLMLARPTRSSKTSKSKKAYMNSFLFVPVSLIQKTLPSASCTAPRLRPQLGEGSTTGCVTERCSSQVKFALA